VDAVLREKWLHALTANQAEVHCEKLGAIHLLGHGIFGFKATGEGAATDLVLGEPLSPGSPGVASARALVLTEWKVVRPTDTAAEKAEEARRQASRCATGLLGAFELRTTRYVVLVSRDELDRVPAAMAEGSVTYEHVSIVVSRPVPSRHARRRA
jgi:hypothetical protein